MSSSTENPEPVLLIPTAAWLQGFSWGGSFLMHISGLVLLAALILPGQGDAPSALEGEFGTTVAETIDFTPHAPLVLEPASPAGEEPLTNELLTSISTDPPELPDAPSAAEETADIGTPEPLALEGLLAAAAGTGSAGQGTGKGTGNGSGKGKGKGSGKGKGAGGKGSFFGLNVKGKSTVFVVDASRSMNMLHPGPMRTRFNRVKLELVRAISNMTEDEKFFVIFFGDGAIPMPANRMMEAEPNVRKRYLQWVATQQAVGQTFPAQALLLSLQLQPDIIYFLTDGEFDFSVVPGVTAANVQGIPIHTIGFSDNRGENLLMEIARRNNGTYTYIPPDEGDGEPGDAGDSAAAIISGLGN